MNNAISRKGFISSAAILGFGGLISRLPAVGFDTLRGPNPDLVLNTDEGEVYLIGERQGRVTIKVDKRNKGIETMSILTEDITPGDGIPVHKHSYEEELIFIEHGQGILTFGSKEFNMRPGSMAIVPRGVWHGLRNEKDEMLRMVFGYSPAGFEDYFRHIGVKPGEPWEQLTNSDWSRINKKFGVVYRG